MIKTLSLKIKNHLIGFLAGVFAATAVTAFAASNPGSIGSLFTDIGGGIYKLIGTNIKDGSITSTQVGFNYAGSTSKGGPADSVNFNGGLTTTSTPTFAGIIATSYIWSKGPIYFADGTSQSTAASYTPPIVGDWVNIVNNTYAPGPGNRSSGWNYVPLNSTKKLLGLKMSGSSDDGGACVLYISGYFSAGITHIGYLTTLSLFGNWNGSAWNNGAGQMASATFLFESTPPGSSLGAQNYGNNTAYNKGFVGGYLPAGLGLYYSQWYNDGQGAYNNTCIIDALYSAN